MKLCPCGRYRQLNSVLYPNTHILTLSKTSLKRVLGLAGKLKVGKPKLCFFSSKLNTGYFL